jgi:hypothetical protein
LVAEDSENGLCLGKVYDYDEVYGILRENGHVPHVVPRDAERELIEKLPGYILCRWLVERTISRQNRFRRILVHWEKKIAHSLAMVHLACAFVAFKHSGLA